MIGPLYPQPAMAGNAYITSQATTVTSGATTVTGYTTGGIGAVQLVAFTISTDAVRCYWDGSTPTSTTGHYLAPNVEYLWAANRYNQAKFILAASSTVAVITASPLNGG